MVFYANDILDPLRDWVMSEAQFNDYINHKYHERIWESRAVYYVGDIIQYYNTVYKCTEKHSSDPVLTGVSPSPSKFIRTDTGVWEIDFAKKVSRSGFASLNTLLYAPVGEDLNDILKVGYDITYNQETRNILSIAPDGQTAVMDNTFLTHLTVLDEVAITVGYHAYFYNHEDNEAGQWLRIINNTGVELEAHTNLPTGCDRVEIMNPDVWEEYRYMIDGVEYVGDPRPGFVVAHQTIKEYIGRQGLITDFDSWYNDVSFDLRNAQYDWTQHGTNSYIITATDNNGHLYYISAQVNNTIITDQFTGDGLTSEFVLSEFPLNEYSVRVSKDNINLTMPSHYTVSQRTVVFSHPPKNGSNIVVTYSPNPQIIFTENDIKTEADPYNTSQILNFGNILGEKYALSFYEYEYNVNESKRKIKIIDRTYQAQMMQEFKKLLNKK
jgi:hypothetical protein